MHVFDSGSMPHESLHTYPISVKISTGGICVLGIAKSNAQELDIATLNRFAQARIRMLVMMDMFEKSVVLEKIQLISLLCVFIPMNLRWDCST